jgi:hypothetical protein
MQKADFGFNDFLLEEMNRKEQVIACNCYMEAQMCPWLGSNLTLCPYLLTIIPLQNCQNEIWMVCLFCCGLCVAGKVSGELPECTQDLMTDVTTSYYQHFRPHGKGKWSGIRQQERIWYKNIGRSLLLRTLWYIYVTVAGRNLSLRTLDLLVCYVHLEKQSTCATRTVSLSMVQGYKYNVLFPDFLSQ